MKKTTLIKINEGTIFKCSDGSKAKIWIKRGFCKESKGYLCELVSDSNVTKIMGLKKHIYLL